MFTQHTPGQPSSPARDAVLHIEVVVAEDRAGDPGLSAGGAWQTSPRGALTIHACGVIEGDVRAVIAAGAGAYDATMLDVYNGPDGISREGNDQLSRVGEQAAARAALRPCGLLAVWSAAPDAAFARGFRTAGFSVEEHVVRARSNGNGPRHVIWVGIQE